MVKGKDIAGRRLLADGAREYLTLDDDTLVRQCIVDAYRASGPGGQKRNKTSSAVRLRHEPTGLVAIAEEDRSQHVNKTRAVRRLRETIALHLRRDVDVSNYRTSDRLAAHVTKDGRLRVNPHNPNYAGIVAEVLDVLAATGARVSEAAACVGISTAQLLQFFQRDPKLWEHVNQMRAAAGLNTLK